ncbi:hypothetical protein FH972_022298 [Carpinus fangiana]|uniref:Uncharacterized protein n=1 Tax=Carpinus fangiana TaxID=176857 RepID=A0A5N6KRU6_9ROSI|nr:hypothetical protein FH972_022298 [Carpinus fangiana]
MPSASVTLLSVLSLAVSVSTQETVYASFVLTRTGDRSPLIEEWLDITQLSPLGANSLYDVGSELRARYINSSSSPSTSIAGLSSDVIDPVQLYILASDAQYTTASAQAFMQAFYPPTDAIDTTGLNLAQLSNNSIVRSPMNGYQYSWIHAAGLSDPDSIYVRGSYQCGAWQDNANSWIQSPEFHSRQSATNVLYSNAGDVLGDDTLPASSYNYADAGAIADYLVYMDTHNNTFSDLLHDGSRLNTSHFGDLLALANEAQWAVHGTALAELPANGADSEVDFTAVPAFGAHLILELFTNNPPADNTTYPSDSDLRVRMLFRNGTDTSKPLTTYPLFGTADSSLPWSTFKASLDTISLEAASFDTESEGALAAWCRNCDAWTTTQFCLAVNPDARAAVLGSAANGTGSASHAAPHPGMSHALAGAIGAVATLCLFGLILFLGVGCLGWRVTRKPLGGHGAAESVGGGGSVQRASGGGGFKGGMKLASDTDLPGSAEGVAEQDEVGEAGQGGEGVEIGEGGEAVVGEDEGGEGGQGGGEGGVDGGDAVAGEQQRVQAREEGEVGERGDGVVGEVEGVAGGHGGRGEVLEEWDFVA